MDEIFKEFHTILQTNRKEDKLGIYLALNKILDMPQETQIVMYVNKLIPDVRAQLEQNYNVELVEKGAECLGNLARSGGNMTAKNIEDTLEKAIELLKQNNRSNNSDIKKYAAVLILRELSKKLPVITFNKLFSPTRPYLDVFQACRDNREHVRDAAAQVINACISHICDHRQKRKSNLREAEKQTGKIKMTETMMIFAEVEKAFGKDDDQNYQHSALTILGQLIAQDVSTELISSRDGNGNRFQAERIIHEIQRMLRESKSTLVKKKCIDLIPSMYKFIPSYYKQPGKLYEVIKEIEKYISESKGKDRGQGFISLGKLSVRADNNDFEPHIKDIVELIYKEIKSPIRQRDNTIKPNVELDALQCFTYLLKHHGRKIDSCIQMTHFISDIFLAGFKDEVIQCLSHISRIEGYKYKRHCQIKLLNSCSIILTRKVDRFPFHLDEQLLSPAQSAPAPSRSVRRQAPGDIDEDGHRVSNFGGNLEPRESADSRTSQLMSHVHAQKHHTKNLTDLYNDILVKTSQNFLNELIDQSSQPVIEGNTASQELSNERTQMVTLALKTLSIFDFSEYAMCIVYFIERSVLDYLDDENPQIRKLAM